MPNSETWGVLAHPPATVAYLRRRALIKAMRRHREDIDLARFLAVLRSVRDDQAQRLVASGKPNNNI